MRLAHHSVAVCLLHFLTYKTAFIFITIFTLRSRVLQRAGEWKGSLRHHPCIFWTECVAHRLFDMLFTHISTARTLRALKPSMDLAIQDQDLLLNQSIDWGINQPLFWQSINEACGFSPLWRKIEASSGEAINLRRTIYSAQFLHRYWSRKTGLLYGTLWWRPVNASSWDGRSVAMSQLQNGFCFFSYCSQKSKAGESGWLTNWLSHRIALTHRITIWLSGEEGPVRPREVSGSCNKASW